LRVVNEPYDALAASSGSGPGWRVTTFTTPPGADWAKASGVALR
jgi:hypothetical protein